MNETRSQYEGLLSLYTTDLQQAIHELDILMKSLPPLIGSLSGDLTRTVSIQLEKIQAATLSLSAQASSLVDTLNSTHKKMNAYVENWERRIRSVSENEITRARVEATDISALMVRTATIDVIRAELVPTMLEATAGALKAVEQLSFAAEEIDIRAKKSRRNQRVTFVSGVMMALVTALVFNRVADYYWPSELQPQIQTYIEQGKGLNDVWADLKPSTQEDLRRHLAPSGRAAQ